MKLLSETAIRENLPVQAVIAANRSGFLSLHQGNVQESRTLLETRKGHTLIKPCDLKPSGSNSGGLGLKVISVRNENEFIGLSTTPAVMILLDRDTGVPEAVLSASYLTALRTAAGSAIATELLFHAEGPVNLCIFGAGLQAEAHAYAVCEVVQISKIFIINRTLAHAERLSTCLSKILPKLRSADSKTQKLPDIETLALCNPQAVSRVIKTSDIICTTTASPSALFSGKDLKPTAHINAVGSYQAHTTEIDNDTVKKVQVVVDSKRAYSVGDLHDLCEDQKVGTLGELITLQENGSAFENQKTTCTLFKSVGCAVQDLVTAQACLRACADSASFDLLG